jgi:hypothetical protein
LISIEVPLLDDCDGWVGSEFSGPTPGWKAGSVRIFFSTQSPLHYEYINQRHYASKLVQGPEFDSLGNKSVSHKEVEVEGRYIPQDPDTSLVRGPELLENTWWLQAPVFFRPDKTSAAISVFSNWDDLYIAHTYNDGHVGQVTYYGGACVPTDTVDRPYVAYLQVTATSHSSGKDQTIVRMTAKAKWRSSSNAGYQQKSLATSQVVATYVGTNFEGEQAVSVAYAHARLLVSWLHDVSYVTVRQSTDHKVHKDPSHVTGCHPDIDAVWDVVRRRTNHYEGILTYLPWPSPDMSDLVVEAVDANSASTANLLAFVSDLPKAGSTVRELFGVLKTGLTPRKAAGAWLSARYGDRLTVSDARDLFASYQREFKRYLAGFSMGHAYRQDSSTRILDGRSWDEQTDVAVHLAVRLASFTPLMTAIKRLMDWDAWPTLENTWDLVPFSFVVDWFSGVSRFLNACDAAIKAPYLRPVTQYASIRRVLTLRSSDEMGGLTVRLVMYRRQKTDLLGRINPFETQLDPTFSIVNAVDGASLLALTR